MVAWTQFAPESPEVQMKPPVPPKLPSVVVTPATVVPSPDMANSLHTSVWLVEVTSVQLAPESLEIHGLPVFVSSNITEDKVIAMDPSFSRLVYFGAPQIVIDPYRRATNGVTHVQVLNAVDFVCTHQPSICIGSA